MAKYSPIKGKSRSVSVKGKPEASKKLRKELYNKALANREIARKNKRWKSLKGKKYKKKPPLKLDKKQKRLIKKSFG